MRACKAPLSADTPPRRVEDTETRIIVYEPCSARRARYMLPQEGLAMQPKAEDQMNRAAMRGGRTETGATLYEIANPCRCTTIDEETGRRIWNPLCGPVRAPRPPRARAEARRA